MILAMFLLCIFSALFFGLFFGIGLLLFKILYTFCIGLPVAVCLAALGLLFCITIIGIPVGMLIFRLAGFVLVPFR